MRHSESLRCYLICLGRQQSVVRHSASVRMRKFDEPGHHLARSASGADKEAESSAVVVSHLTQQRNCSISSVKITPPDCKKWPSSTLAPSCLDSPSADTSASCQRTSRSTSSAPPTHPRPSYRHFRGPTLAVRAAKPPMSASLPPLKRASRCGTSDAPVWRRA